MNKVLEFIKMVLKGAVMGIANVVPGVSGGTMAVSMGIYDTLIHALTHLFKEFKKSVVTVLPIVLGMGLGIVGVAKIIELLFEHFPAQTNLLFIGLILGGIPLIAGKIKGATFKAPHILAFVFFLALILVMAVLGEGNGAETDLSVLNVGTAVKLFFVGVIAAATMVIPGVSGSMVLLLIGYYNPIISFINEFVHALTSLDMASLGSCCVVLIPFGLGVVIGIFAIAKLIEVLLEKFPQVSYCGILGLIVASPFAIIILNLDVFKAIQLNTAMGWVTVLTSVVTFVAGYACARKLGD